LLDSLLQESMLRNGRIVFKGCNRLYCNRAKADYIQGQSPEPGIREYFFYVDHNGMLFQDDSRMKHFTAALKEKKLLFNFFKRIKPNSTGRYDDEFKYISLCGRERNFVRSLDRPIVFTHVKKLEIRGREGWFLLHNWADDLLVQPFQPELICMVPNTGRVYHPGPSLSGGIGLVADKLAIQWTSEARFRFADGEENAPTAFVWEEREVGLGNELLDLMTAEERGEDTNS